jgi:hypothetical protein
MCKGAIKTGYENAPKQIAQRVAATALQPLFFRRGPIRRHDLATIVHGGPPRFVGSRVGADLGCAVEWKENLPVCFSDDLQSTYVTAVACSVIARKNLEVIVSNVGLMSRHVLSLSLCPVSAPHAAPLCMARCPNGSTSMQKTEQ